jgi:signal transduction histidine kinase
MKRKLRRSIQRIFADTIAARTIFILLTGLFIFHVLSALTYRIGFDTDIDITNHKRLAERLASISRAITDQPENDRENLAHWLSGGALEVHWSKTPLVSTRGRLNEKALSLRHQIDLLSPEISQEKILIGSNNAADPHLLFLSWNIGKSSWVNYTISALDISNSSLIQAIFSTTLLVLVILFAAIIILNMSTRPLRECATAARQLFTIAEPVPMKVSGPREVRDVATAFNQMQGRVKHLIDERVMTLAAISHDLKSPLARLSLRIEKLENLYLKSQCQADVYEMSEMIDDILAFNKSDKIDEEVREFDIQSLLETIHDEFSDLGCNVSLNIERREKISGYPLALKRAFNNIIVNALKYGTCANINIYTEEACVLIAITDEGPGIPLDEQELVFRPFYRIENSRSRQTGGVGLGLSIARRIVLAHRGSITLENVKDAGVRVSVRLPVSG